MKTGVVLVTVLAIAAAASYDYDYNELKELQEAIHRAASEKLYLKERVAALFALKEDFRDSVDSSSGFIITKFADSIFPNGDILPEARTDIKDASQELNELEAAVARELNIAQRVPKVVSRTWEHFEHLEVNPEQTADIAKGIAILDRSFDVEDKEFTAAGLELSLAGTALLSNARDFEKHLETRRCIVRFVNVTLDPETAEGMSAITFPPNTFSQITVTPTVMCGITGVTNRVGLDEKQGYGYGYDYSKDRQTAAVSVDCAAGTDGVDVRAFDLSRAQYNQVSQVFVVLRLCSLGAQGRDFAM